LQQLALVYQLLHKKRIYLVFRQTHTPAVFLK
jgi:hypothetical protein